MSGWYEQTFRLTPSATDNLPNLYIDILHDIAWHKFAGIANPAGHTFTDGASVCTAAGLDPSFAADIDDVFARMANAYTVGNAIHPHGPVVAGPGAMAKFKDDFKRIYRAGTTDRNNVCGYRYDHAENPGHVQAILDTWGWVTGA